MSLEEATVPESVKELMEIAGTEATLKILKAYRGWEIDIPRHPRPGQKLVELVGIEAAQAISKQYGGTKVNVPRCHKAALAHRNASIIRAYDRGESVRDIAHKHNLTARWVKKIINRPEQQTDQFILPLFD